MSEKYLPHALLPSKSLRHPSDVSWQEYQHTYVYILYRRSLYFYIDFRLCYNSLKNKRREHRVILILNCSFRATIFFFLFNDGQPPPSTPLFGPPNLRKTEQEGERSKRNPRAKALSIGEHAHKLFSIQEAPSGTQRSCVASVRDYVSFWRSDERRGGRARLPAHAI